MKWEYIALGLIGVSFLVFVASVQRYEHQAGEELVKRLRELGLL